MRDQTRLEALKNKHFNLEQTLKNESKHPYQDDLFITGIKRKKLRIKDELENLRETNNSLK